MLQLLVNAEERAQTAQTQRAIAASYFAERDSDRHGKVSPCD